MAIDAMTMDVLKEIGNIGTGNAANALSTMLNCKVDIGLPKCEMVPFAHITRGFESAEELVVGVLVQLSGDMEGFIMMVLTVDAAFELIELLTGEKIKRDYDDYSNVFESLRPMEEIGNILIGAYLSAICGMVGMSVRPSVPSLSVDMVQAIMNLPAAVYGEVGDAVLDMETDFFNDKSSVKGRYFLIPTVESQARLLAALGM